MLRLVVDAAVDADVAQDTGLASSVGASCDRRGLALRRIGGREDGLPVTDGVASWVAGLAVAGAATRASRLRLRGEDDGDRVAAAAAGDDPLCDDSLGSSAAAAAAATAGEECADAAVNTGTGFLGTAVGAGAAVGLLEVEVAVEVASGLAVAVSVSAADSRPLPEAVRLREMEDDHEARTGDIRAGGCAPTLSPSPPVLSARFGWCGECRENEAGQQKSQKGGRPYRVARRCVERRRGCRSDG